MWARSSTVTATTFTERRRRRGQCNPGRRRRLQLRALVSNNDSLNTPKHVKEAHAPPPAAAAAASARVCLHNLLVVVGQVHPAGLAG